MSVRDSGPNWGLAFGSASFLIVWLLGFLANIAIEVIALRACVATILGAVVGLLFGQVVRGLQAMQGAEPKGRQFDFTVPADDAELRDSLTHPDAETLTATVPQAPATPVAEAFQPLDFKQAARQIQNTMKE